MMNKVTDYPVCILANSDNSVELKILIHIMLPWVIIDSKSGYSVQNMRKNIIGVWRLAPQAGENLNPHQYYRIRKHNLGKG